jgi:hypothetical protein
MRVEQLRRVQEENRSRSKKTPSQTALVEQADVRSLRASGTFGMTYFFRLGMDKTFVR